MKRTILFSIALLSVFTGFAQSRLIMRTTSQLKKHRQFINYLQNQQSFLQKTTAVHERVLAEADDDLSNGAFGAPDSTVFSYSGMKGSTYDYNQLAYNLEYPYDTNPMYEYQGHHNKPTVLCDTAKLWYQGGNNNTYGLQELAISGYDGNNNITGFLDLYIDSVTQSSNHYVNAFNGNNNATYSLNLTGNGNFGYDSSLETFYTYDGQNRLTTDSFYSHNGGTWALIFKYNYTYDNNSNMTGVEAYQLNNNVWDTLERYFFTYDNNNKMQTARLDYSNGGVFQTAVIDTFGYSNGVNFHTYWLEKGDIGNPTLDTVLTLNYHLNQQNLPDSIHYSGYNGTGIDTFEVPISYNSFNDPTAYAFYQYHAGILDDTAQLQTNYYYQLYFDESVAGTATQSMKVFPNPTNNNLNIQLANVAANSTATARLMGADGRTVITQTINGGKAVLSMQQLATGTYWLITSDNNGKTIGKQTVVKY